MKFRDGIGIAWRSLTGHRLRSALTTVGIVIGIATVIIFASFGTSVQTDIVGEFEDTAASEIIIVTGDVGLDPSSGGDGGPPPSADELGNIALPGITVHDLDQLSQIDGVRSVIPRGSIDASSVSYQNETRPQSVIATTPAALPEENFVSGGPFEQGDSGEIVLSETAANEFEGDVGVNDTVVIDYGNSKENFTVVGIISQARGGLNVFGSFSAEVYVPTDPYYREYGNTVESPSQGVEQAAYRQVTVVAEPNQVSETRDRIERYFEEESDAGQVVEEGVTVQSTAAIVDGIESVLNDVIQLVSGIGILALLVGAFGIANIMLVSVTERTKEIGIMKANGAHNREVMGLFLAESTLLGLAGAVVGIPVGLIVGFGAAAYAEVGFTVPFGWIAVATAMGITTGIVAGLYPAWRAARVDPIDALRYE
ncbi:FtsX-like permease family protein [Halovenus sp. WSH3]|uniref:FtsX-like permease family protein n=1 Tax=Halovenus carboxidivorans TaxID=2692199 RepID=A0A6B0T6A6_9EURY|nr:ABC transporter permease [Halovenus carboxidivorans]MXR50812.1 FtsX-like permease family protein [Halovenus carboxidivorans]